MTEETCDVLVAGGGPAGSSVATMLRKHGYDVIVLERERYPRFHIGESLLPHTMGLLRTLGAMPAVEAAGFVPKWGARFTTGDGDLTSTFYFRDGFVAGAPGAYQVLRSRFDALLLENSRTHGADVREGHALKDVAFEADAVRAKVRDAQGGDYTIRARFFADATGQHSFLAHKLRMRRLIPALAHIAIYGHFKGVVRDEGIDAGNTISIAIRYGWMWFIPLADDITSIGAVVRNDEFRKSGLSAEAYFDRVVQAVPVISERLHHAERISTVHVTSDFSFTAGTLYGDRHLILGDAGFFLDPIFSSGVHLAISAGVHGADAIHEHLTGRRWPWRHPLQRHTRRMWRSQRPYWAFVHGWYSEGFLELFLRPTDKIQMVPAIVSVLAGSAQISPGVRLRTRVFLFLVWLQRTFGFLEEPIDRARLPGV